MLNPTKLSATLCWLGYEFRVKGGLGYDSAFAERECGAWGTQCLNHLLAAVADQVSLKDNTSLDRLRKSMRLRSKYVQGETRKKIV